MEVFARAVAAAFLDGPWDLDSILQRVRASFGGDRPWTKSLVESVFEAVLEDEVPESLDELAALLPNHSAFWAAVHERPLDRAWDTPASEMTESPWPIPALATSKELAVWLGVDVGALVVLADRRGLSRSAKDPRMRHYRYTWLAKRNGGHRLLEAPKARLRTVQRYVLDGILAHIPPHEAAHGFRRRHSILGFVAPHVGRRVVVRVDLQAFFTSVVASRVAGIFRTAGYPEEVARGLAALCTHRTASDVIAAAPRDEANQHARLRVPHLPQGAPTSGALANLAAYQLDARVAALAASVGASYTRYADDLVLSGDRELVRASRTLVARLGAIAIEEGFALNFRKTRVMTSGTRQRITGLVVNDKIALSRDELERLRAILHNCVRTGPAAQNRDGHQHFRAHLLGRISWVAAINPHKAARLREIFARIRWDEA